MKVRPWIVLAVVIGFAGIGGCKHMESDSSESGTQSSSTESTSGTSRRAEAGTATGTTTTPDCERNPTAQGCPQNDTGTGTTTSPDPSATTPPPQ